MYVKSNNYVPVVQDYDLTTHDPFVTNTPTMSIIIHRFSLHTVHTDFRKAI